MKKRIKAGNGNAKLMTVSGEKLWVMLHEGKHLMLKNEKGNTAYITIADVFEPNGVIHVIDTVPN